MSSQAFARLSRWLQRSINTDERYICAACDDRFPGRDEGVAHVVHSHPEFAGALADEVINSGWRQVVQPCPTPTVPAPTGPLMPAAGWS